ncbi:MAG: hypothetical protein F7B61_01485, partial [Caldisphaeraceae archaeon]|nr:hypothetical protein [Caldisphaeraceae archaeon]
MPGSVYAVKRRLPPYEAQAGLEAMIGYSLKQQGSTFGVISKLASEGVMLGLYCNYPPRKGDESLARRVTGGPRVSFSEDSIYLGVAINKASALRSLRRVAAELFECIVGQAPHGGKGRGGINAAYGITKVGNSQVIEIVSDEISREPSSCLMEVLHEGIVIREVERVFVDREKVSSYGSSSWLYYPSKKLEHTKHIASGGFFVEVSASLHEGFIKDINISGNFYASPPYEPINAIIALEGTPVGELYFYGVKKRVDQVEFEGVSNEDVKEALDSLFNEISGHQGS